MYLYEVTSTVQREISIFAPYKMETWHTMNKKVFLINLLILLCAALGSMAQPRYNYSKLQREQLGRGVMAIRQDPFNVYVTWRYLSSDPVETEFNVYRNGIKQTTVPASCGTFWIDANPSVSEALYEVRPVVKGVETHAIDGVYTLPANAPVGYLNIPLDRPGEGVTPAGDSYFYVANDAGIGDVDGDGEYEIILKWEPSNAHDNSHDGYTGNVIFDCYRLNGERLWRIDMGHNVRAGAHYTQFMVYDLDGDGHAEIVMKTADGTVDGVGKVIGDSQADYREIGDTVEFAKRMAQRKEEESRSPGQGEFVRQGGRRRYMYGGPKNQGRILSGPEYLTVFKGSTGEAMYTTDYIPARGKLDDWGDNRANRSDRFLACVAYLDGLRPSVVMCRGYYTRTVLAAYDWDGNKLKQRWVFDSNTQGNEEYAGQGNHNLRVGDVDGDGCDEIIYGSCVINNDGTGLNNNRTGHGDALHMTCFIPDTDRMQIWDCHENKRDGSTFRDAGTGEMLFQIKDSSDVGRCMAADIDPTSPGVEMWSLASGGIRNYKGEIINPAPERLSCNMAVWWDGDLLRELLDRNYISKYDWETGACRTLARFDDCTWNNGTKANPCLQGDLIGDWREEVLLRTEDNSALRLYVSTIPTEYRFHTFLEDPVYRISIATQNVAYNQPTQPGFYFGPDLKKGSLFRGTIIR